MLLLMQPHPRMSPVVILGHSRSLFGQLSSTSVYIIRTGGSLHLVSICSIVSVVSHVLCCARWVSAWIVVQNVPIFCIPCIVLKRNCLILGCISFHQMLIHIVSSVSRVPAYLWMATLVFWRFSWVVLLGRAFLASFIPLYAIA
jgi:hypothetical protein